MRLAILSLALVCLDLKAQQLAPGDPLVVVRNGRYGYIDRSGRVVIKPQFIWGSWFSKGSATVYICGREISIDSSGNLHPERFAPDGELVPRGKAGKIGFVDAYGDFKIAPIFDDALPFSDGFAAVKVDDQWGFVNANGDIVISPRFRHAFYFQQGIGMAESDQGGVFIDRRGNVVATGNAYANITEGRIPVTGSHKSGYLDLQGNIAIPFVYDEVQSFSNGLAAVASSDKFGYIDREGQLVIPFQFDDAGPFIKNLAPVKIGSQSGFINMLGKFVFRLPFDNSPGFIADDAAPFWTTNRLFGYVNTSGKVIWGPTKGSADHRPLFGWSKADEIRSCKGVPKVVRDRIEGYATPE